MRFARTAALLAALICSAALPAHADDTPPLPGSVATASDASLKLLGGAKYRKLGFSVYRVALWASDSGWNTKQPFALQLIYNRDLSKETLVDGVMDGIREQNAADAATLTKWQDLMNRTLPAVAEGDSIIGLSRPGRNALLFHNGQQILEIDDKDLAAAFFNIWLGPQADADMRANLLAQNKE